MTLADFKTDLAFAEPFGQAVADHLQQQPGLFSRFGLSVEHVEDVQDDPDAFYYGDILITLRDLRTNKVLQHFLELKVERYYTDKTPNFAIEHYSNFQQATAGGPFKSRGTWYAHLFIDGHFFIMERAKLVRMLLDRQFQFRTWRKPNAGYYSTGYLVPRSIARIDLGTSFFHQVVPEIGACI